MNQMKTNNFAQILRYIFLIILFLFVSFPLFYIISGSLKSSTDLARNTILPSGFRYDNFLNVFSYPEILFSFVNSTLITITALFITVNSCFLAAYAIARRKEKIFQGWYLFFLSAMMIPGISTLVMLYRLILVLGLMNTRLALVIIYSGISIPFGILIFTGFIKTVPISLDESAMIEGCSYLSRLYKVILPLVQFAVIIFIVMQLPVIWNDFLYPLLFIQSKWKITITLGVYNFSRVREQDSGAIFALLTLAMIPPVVFFIFSQKYIYQGITAGAVKQ